MTAKTAVGRHRLGQVPVEDYFDSPEEMGSRLAAVRYKVVSCFLRATHPETHLTTGRDNHIVGLGSKVVELERYVATRISLHHEFALNDLPRREVGQLSRAARQRIVDDVRRRMITMVIAEMMEDGCTLYYLDGLGIWCFTSVLRLEHDHIARIQREKGNTYQGNNRGWHGRPDNQGRRRAKLLGFAPGVSIGI